MREADYGDRYIYRGVIEVAFPEGGAQRWVYGPYRTEAAARQAIARTLRAHHSWFYFVRDALSTHVEVSRLTWRTTDVSSTKGRSHA